MDFNRLSSLASRVFFFAALALLAVAVLERLTNAAGYTIVPGYSPSRLLELATIFVVFVIAILLRQIREELRRAK